MVLKSLLIGSSTNIPWGSRWIGRITHLEYKNYLE